MKTSKKKLVCFIPVYFAKQSRDLTRLKLRPAKLFLKKHKTDAYVHIVLLCIVIDWRSMLKKNSIDFCLQVFKNINTEKMLCKIRLL